MEASHEISSPPLLSAVQTFADRVQPEVFLYEDQDFGRFHFTPSVVFNRDNPHFSYETEDGLYVKVDLDYTRQKVQIGSIAVLLGGEWWSVDRYNIICKTNPDHERDLTFPAWELRWANDANRPQQIGELQHVAYTIAEHQGVFYNYEGRFEHRRVFGRNVDAAQFPESLIDQSEFQGRKLDWKLDTKSKEQEIISRSAIYEFLVSVPTR